MAGKMRLFNLMNEKKLCRKNYENKKASGQEHRQDFPQISRPWDVGEKSINECS
jgi:hypothetical protein